MGTKNAGAKRVAKKKALAGMECATCGQDASEHKVIESGILCPSKKNRKRQYLSSSPVTVEQHQIISNLLDTKIDDIRKAMMPVQTVIKGEHTSKQNIELIVQSSRYHWHDLVWCVAIGMVVGFIISNS